MRRYFKLSRSIAYYNKYRKVFFFLHYNKYKKSFYRVIINIKKKNFNRVIINMQKFLYRVIMNIKEKKKFITRYISPGIELYGHSLFEFLVSRQPLASRLRVCILPSAPGSYSPLSYRESMLLALLRRSAL